VTLQCETYLRVVLKENLPKIQEIVIILGSFSDIFSLIDRKTHQIYRGDSPESRIPPATQRHLPSSGIHS